MDSHRSLESAAAQTSHRIVELVVVHPIQNQTRGQAQVVLPSQAVKLMLVVSNLVWVQPTNLCPRQGLLMPVQLVLPGHRWRLLPVERVLPNRHWC